VFQDIFVISILNGKQGGTYLEIGSGDPFKGSNTYLLESEFGWRGLSIEIKEEDVKKFNKKRKNPVLCMDASCINYEKHLEAYELPKNIDYLQVDCEPPETTYRILTSIPFDKYKFGVITFEHDYYADAYKKYRKLSRDFLRSFGYELVVPDVSMDDEHSFEDWWVHPNLIDREIINKMKVEEGKVYNAKEYMMSNPNN